MGEVADDKDVGEIGDGEIGVDLDFAGAVGFGTSAFGDAAAKRSGVHATGPENGFGVKMRGGVGAFEVEAVGGDVGDESVFVNFDAETSEERFGFGGEIFGIGGEDARAAFHKNDAGFLGTDAAEIVAKGLASDFGEGAGEFEAGGASSDDDEGEPGACFGFGRGAFGALKGEEKFVADGGGFLNGFEAGSNVAPLIFAEVGGFGAGGDDEHVVGEDGAVAESDGFGDGVEVHGFAKEDFGVFLAAEDGAKRRGDFTGRERASGDLIEKRLEKMEVALVEEGDAGGCALEGLGGDESAETAAEDEDARQVGHEAPERRLENRKGKMGRGEVPQDGPEQRRRKALA